MNSSFLIKIIKYRFIILFFLIIFIIGNIVFILLISGITYKDIVLPGIYINDYPIGKMTKEELRFFFKEKQDKLIKEGIKIIYKAEDKEENITIYPTLETDDITADLINFDIEKNSDFFVNIGKDKNILKRGLNVLISSFKKQNIQIPYVKIEEKILLDIIKENLSSYENPAKDAKLIILSIKPLEYQIIPSSTGFIYEYDKAISEIENSYRELKKPIITINKKKDYPKIEENKIKSNIKSIYEFFNQEDIYLTYNSPINKIHYEWKISLDDMKNWIEAQKTEDNRIVFVLSEKELYSYLEKNVAPKINSPKRNAKFKVNKEGIVEEFQGAKNGIEIDLKETIKTINEKIKQRTIKHEDIEKTNYIDIVFKIIEPEIKTEDVNNLDIKEILATAVLSYKNSPENRIKNIKNGIKKLNGILIKPNEEFSTLEALKPINAENGYVKSQIIAGNAIINDIGGGICHLSTGLFWLAMNSGLNITERKNHGLILSYYLDQRNNMPGIDATIYDPIIDFRFINDTGNYILIEAEINEKEEQIELTLWGKNDGRKGYFSPPVIKRWINPGKKKIIYTKALKQNQITCQSSFRGAETSFTYIREFKDGRKEEKLFESFYKALPETCWIGFK